MPDSGPNEHKLELREVAPSAALTVNPSPAPRRLDDQGPARAGAPSRARCGGQLPHLPGQRHHGLPAQQRQPQERPGQRRPQVALHHQALRPHCLSKLTLETYLTPCPLLKSAPSVRNAGGRVVGFFRLGGVAQARTGLGWERVAPVRARGRRLNLNLRGEVLSRLTRPLVTQNVRPSGPR